MGEGSGDMPVWCRIVSFYKHQVHLPGYVKDYEQLKAKGVDVIACVSVNDVFVMRAWGELHKATGKIHMLADATGDVAKV